MYPASPFRCLNTPLTTTLNTAGHIEHIVIINDGEIQITTPPARPRYYRGRGINNL